MNRIRKAFADEVAAAAARDVPPDRCRRIGIGELVMIDGDTGQIRRVREPGHLVGDYGR